MSAIQITSTLGLQVNHPDVALLALCTPVAVAFLFFKRQHLSCGLLRVLQSLRPS